MIDINSFWSEISLFWSFTLFGVQFHSFFWGDFHSFSSEWRITHFVHSFTFREYVGGYKLPVIRPTIMPILHPMTPFSFSPHPMTLFFSFVKNLS